MEEEIGYVAYVGYDDIVRVEEVSYIRQPTRIRITSNMRALGYRTYLPVDDPRIKPTPELAGEYLRGQLTQSLEDLEWEKRKVARCYRQVGAAVRGVRSVINRAEQLREEALKGRV